MFKNYFKTAFRNFRRNKVYSIINILGLSLGLACGMLIILYVKDELSYDRFHAQVNQLYRIGMKRIKPDGSVESKGGFTGYFQGPRFTANIPEIQAFVRVQNNQRDIKNGTEIKSQEVHLVDSNFLSAFSFPLLSGNPKTALRDLHSVVITEEVARTLFGTKEALGKTIVIKNEEGQFVPHEVTGVAKKCPQNSSIKFNMLLPIEISKETEAQNMNWMNYFLSTFVVMAPGANPLAVEAKMKQVYEKDARESIKISAEQYGDDAATFYSLQPFTDIHLSEDYQATNGLTDASKPMYSYILSGIALFILLIACINFVNLTVARSLKRAKEIGIRKVIGGDRRQLMVQFLGESFILCFVAFVLAVLMVQLVLPIFNDLSNKALALSYLFDAKLIGIYIGLFIVTSLLAGFYPSLVLSAYSPVKTLYSRFTLAGKNYLQKSLVVLQFTLASFLIIATITIYAQFNYLTNEKLGYDDSNLVLANLPTIKASKTVLLKEELLKSPAIVDVACKNVGSWSTVAKVNGSTEISFAYETVTEPYIPLLQIPLIKGRSFSKDFPSDSTHSVVVNEAFAKKAGWANPIGQEVNFWYNKNEKYQVIGVVKDYHYAALTEKIKPQLFTMKPGNSLGLAFIKIKPDGATAALQHIEKTFKTFYPNSPYSYIFKDQENLKSYEAEARWKKIMLFGAVLTIFISCIGLFGLSVMSAEKRVKEIGIRKVLGATVGHVVTILSRDFLLLVTLALIISIPIAWVTANAWLANYPYRITVSWWMFALAGVLVAMVAMFTISFNALKAAVANPVKSLRSE
ncbi:ABC transporter permease [Paraflavitalea soli]|uniref:ABC transporter permease n=1 Tax=Paraflavitalea soli TaxID=2315862 RepID=A0A3B7MJQ1_9BACT|nr:ABC transporter permease [Paraflavitalea soli]AXY73350.1 ABC transporter permease [Paraflavitalea soli]